MIDKPKKRRQCRPSLCTKEATARVCEAVRLGATVGVCAARAGVRRRTMHNWWIRGVKALNAENYPETEEPYAHFVNEVIAAKGSFQVKQLETIRDSADGGQVLHEKSIVEADGTEITEKKYARGDWRAAQWLLQTKYSEQFGNHQKITETKNVSIKQQSVNIDIGANLTTAEQMELARLLAKSKEPQAIEVDSDSS